jgi:hypothetical protein
MSRLSRRGYAQAEGRLKRSIALRREGLPHEYPGRDDDLRIMRDLHQRLGFIPSELGFWAWWRRVVGGRI